MATMIPTRLIRTVPELTDETVEQFWADACELHPGWEHVTHRDPLEASDFPLSSPLWDRCTSGAQLAGLVRLEALWWSGGIYLDSDMEIYRPLHPFLHCDAFAGWEDTQCVPDAVIGAAPRHPAIKECLDLALTRLISDSPDWKVGNGAWGTGPGVTTTVFPGRADVLLLPPGSFYPVHYSQKKRVKWSQISDQNPWSFGAHRWHASWLPKGDR